MSDIDQKIVELFNVVKKQKEDVALAEEQTKNPWKTNCSITIGTETQPKAIQSMNADKVFLTVTELLQKKHFAEEAAKILKMKVQPNELKHQNFTFDDWITDLQKRLAIIQLQDKKDELNKIEESLNKVVSPERRRIMEVEAITKSLGLI